MIGWEAVGGYYYSDITLIKYGNLRFDRKSEVFGSSAIP